MLMCIDVGNTNLNFGIYNNDELLCSFRFETKELINSKKLYDNFILGINEYNIMESDIEFVMVDSVVPSINEILIQFFNRINKKYYFVEYNSPLNITLNINNPEELGSDILVGAYEADYKYCCPCFVVDMGTATTILYLSEKKELSGGAILPGLVTSFNSLVQDAALLKKFAVQTPKNVVGNDTISCLQSGMVYGGAAQINGLIKMMKEEIGNNDVKVVITGGIASFIHPFILNSIYDENLLLDGLRDIYKNIIKK